MAIDSISNVGAPAPLPRDPGLNRQPPDAPSIKTAVQPQTQEAVTQAQEVEKHAQGDASVKKGELQNVLKKLNEFVGVSNTDIQFTLDDETGVRVVKVVDRGTKDVIRQIPSEEILQIARALDKLQGLLIRQKA
ncbi:MAG: flagellar protein FlaG [Azonexus sp.]|jgi:flagellar protein FlaG|nr:flagellar protein FlaG [Rhodocyclaceae bacterium]HNI74830.1 flagellar protein FlaG [Accumulibacter sp.]